MNRPGYYVNGRRYPFDRRAQALARAEFLASEYGRDVTMHVTDHTGSESVEHVARFVPSLSTSLLGVL
jgi:hypothetical protein